MDCQVGQSIGAGGDVAGRTVRQPDEVALGNRLQVVRGADGAGSRDGHEQHVEVRFGVSVDAPPGRQMDEVRIKLPSRFRQRPSSTSRYAWVVDELMHVGQDPHRRLIRRDRHRGRFARVLRHQERPARSGPAIPQARSADSPN